MVTGVFCLPLPSAAIDERTKPARAPAAAHLLDEFIGGPENLLVATAAQLFDSDDRWFQPLVLVGPSGVGKTLLARGLAARWAARQGAAKGEVRYTTGVDFARAYATAVETDGVDDLRKRWRAARLLVLEGLEEIAARDGAQRELLFALDDFAQRRARIVVTARTTPAEQRKMLPGLISRLCGGLVTPIVAPGPEARWTIVQRVAQRSEMPIDEESLRKLAEELALPFPHLAGALSQLEAERVARRAETITLETVAKYLAKTAKSRQPSIKEIAAAVAKSFKVKMVELSGPSRRKGVVSARQVAMYLARQLTPESLQEVGRHFGGRDHSTVLHACGKAEELLKSDAATARAVDEIMRSFANA